MEILLVAAENNALNGAKAGGLGDVIGEIGPELAKQGCKVTTVIPSYGFVHKQNKSKYFASVTFSFRGLDHKTDFYEVTAKHPDISVRHLVVDHPLLEGQDPISGAKQIYCNDSSDRPFATDANRFAFFSTAVASALTRNHISLPDCIHLHDWHTAFLLILRKFHPDFNLLKNIRTVYTIHNLALQGIRPFEGNISSLLAWFPGLSFSADDISDNIWKNCVNPMAAGIRLSDAVNTVSPSYAEEILCPCRKPELYSCGEGLENDLKPVKKKGRLFGILNGCSYPKGRQPVRCNFQTLAGLLKSVIPGWLEGKQTVPVSHFLAHARLTEYERSDVRPDILLTSVSRLTDQKMLLMKENNSTGNSGLSEILRLLENQNGLFILLGSGNPEYIRFFTDMSARSDRFIFLNGYSEKCAQALYANGNLFLMPSSFEPCGISQMLAMRDGQPCVVHHVGGLKDTIRNNHNGFAFTGATLARQVDGFINTTTDAVMMRKNNPDQWGKIRRQAAMECFSWQKTAEQYINKLYKNVSVEDLII